MKYDYQIMRVKETICLLKTKKWWKCTIWTVSLGLVAPSHKCVKTSD